MTRRAAIFDLDGTLIDSETVYQESDQTFLDKYGIRLTPTDTREFTGLDSREVIRRIADRHGLPGDTETLLAEKNAVFFETAKSKVRPFPEVLRLAQLLEDRGFVLAIATATTVALREKMVELCGLAELFPIRVSAEEVEHGKPAPDVYLEAARRTGAPPESCVVIEDSQYGVRGAKAARMHVVALPHEVESSVFANVGYLIPGGAVNMDADAVLSWIESTVRPRNDSKRT
jgi:HAD superfamily hydrolase (TIGR01509 family)